MIRNSAALVALLVWGVLSFGAVYPWGYWPLAAGAAVVGIRAAVDTRAWREPRPRSIAIALGVVSLVLLIQLVPLPYDWFRALSPAGDRLFGHLRVGWALHPPAWQSLSIQPASTLVVLAMLLALGTLLVGLTRGIAYMPLVWMVEQLTTFGAILAVLGVAQRVIYGPGDVLVYGFWRPSGPSTPFGPFINRNHFAGWMVLLLPSAIAYATACAQAARGPFLRDWRSWLRWLITPDANRFVFLATAILIMATSLVMTGSRSGLVSLIVALVVLVWFAARGATSLTRRLLPALYGTVLLVAAIGWAGVSQTAARFGQAGTELADRLAAWRDTAVMIRDFPIIGVGFGGYGTAMLAYQTTGRHSIYVQAHNDYLQILAEGGLLAAVPVIVLFVLIVRSIRHRIENHDDPETYWLRAGAVAGLVGIAAQSLVEFSLQMPGNTLMFVFLLAVALHRPSTHTHAHRV